MKKIILCLLAVIGVFFTAACGCTKIDYEVVLSNDGNRTVLIIEKGEKVEKPADPTKEGYTFLGWYKNLTDTKAYDFDEEVTSNFTLYAKWSKEATCNLKCGDGYKLDTTLCECIEDIDVEPPVDEPVEPVKYTVTFNSNGGSKISSKTVVSGEKVTAPYNPTYTGYKFLGWYLNGNKYDFNSKVTSNITLVAKWEKIPVTPAEPVLSYETVEDADSTTGQLWIYLKKGDQRVAGTADVVLKSGTKNKTIPVTGITVNKDRFVTVTNIKVD